MNYSSKKKKSLPYSQNNSSNLGILLIAFKLTTLAFDTLILQFALTAFFFPSGIILTALRGEFTRDALQVFNLDEVSKT